MFSIEHYRLGRHRRPVDPIRSAPACAFMYAVKVPRPRKTNPLIAGSGGAIGAIIGGPVGAIMGAGIGALLATEPPTLEESLAEYLKERGAELVSIRSPSRRAATVAFKTGASSYYSVSVSVPPSIPSDQVDDSLYDAAVTELSKHAVFRQRQPARVTP